MTPVRPETVKLIQMILAILIGVGLFLIFCQSLWVPKVVKFKLEQEGLAQYYSGV